MQKYIKAKIREAKIDGLTVLDLSYDPRQGHVERLTKIPSAVLNFEELTELILYGNALTSIPDEIARLWGLESLDLSSNDLTSVPDKLHQWLPHLTKLDLSRNRLHSLPDSFSLLRKLTYLDLTDTELAEIPDAIFQLLNLRELDLSLNKLTSIPNAISRLENLSKLWLVGNYLTDLPETVARLSKLTVLELGNNDLTFVPGAIYEIASLERLNLSNLKLLENVSASNQIKEISPRILENDNLKSLSVKNNPIELPPLEIVERGVGAVKDYFRQISNDGMDYLYEAKLLIVGEGGAGKTTLAKKIEDAAYELCEEDSTKGIEVIKWTFYLEGGQPFHVNIWDFGGQEIYHATHQFFLTKRSLYALVADTRKDDTDFYYWLSVIELLSDNSPLIIIKNEKQNRHREINIRQLRGQFSNLRETLAANFATDRGMPSILNEVKHLIRTLPHIGTPLPKTWVKVRQILEQDPRDHINIDEYLQICEENGFVRVKDKLQLSGYLHDIGVCLHFQEDPILRKIVILKPKWGTDAVYKVLDNVAVRNNMGKFNRRDLGDIWRDAKYANMHDELLQLMVNFKLCYRIPGGDDYIAPQLLTENQPRYEWNEESNLIMRYTYEFLPKGIITQFIVAMHKLISRQSLVWRSGMILEKEHTKAEVIEHYGKREIKIRVEGKHKKELMTIATYVLDEIHDSYQRLKFRKLIPCNCLKCKDSQEPNFYPVETLKKFLEERHFGIQCYETSQMVDVRSLLDDVVDSDRLAYKYKTEFRSVRNKIFISYSHHDKAWLERLQVMLKPLMLSGKLSVWDDTKIEAGSLWRKEIKEAVDSARVALILVSPNYLASDFITAHELLPLLNSAAAEGVMILWVAVSHSLYKETGIVEYQAAHDPSKPLDSLSAGELNQELARICERIKAAVTGY
jgi:GTPase SAR1 family protein